MIATAVHPQRDTVIYDGQCQFCRSQIAVLKRLDVAGTLAFVSLHDPAVAREFPEIRPEDLRERMYVVDQQGNARGGAEAVRFLARRLPLLWPLAVPLHVPGSLPLWNWLYAWVAKRRYGIAGRCESDGACRLP